LQLIAEWGTQLLLELGMGLSPGRAKRIESAVSICLIAVLFLIGVGVLIKQSDWDMGRFGIGSVSAQLSLQKPDVNTTGEMTLSFLLPAGFEALSKTEFYNAENLYEKINGKAPLYVDSGFNKLSTQRFVSGKNGDLWMELFLFDMGTAKNAFSVYSVQKRAGAEDLEGMQFGYRTSNAIYFADGKYYVELVGSSESAELFKAMTAITQKLRSGLAVDRDSQIVELELFPRENIVPGSFNLYLNSAFGSEGLTDIFTARYNFGDETITAFLGKRANPEEARKAAESYYNFLINNGAVAKPMVSKTLETLKSKVVDLYGTTEIIFVTGPFIGGIHEAENQQTAEKLAETLVKKIGEAVEAKQ